jgi:hypothetical protein
MRRALVALVLALAIASVPVFASLDLRDDRLPAEKAEGLLQQMYGTSYGFECKREDEDESLPLRDVDYICLPNNRSKFAYWIGTDENRITEVAPIPQSGNVRCRCEQEQRGLGAAGSGPVGLDR